MHHIILLVVFFLFSCQNQSSKEETDFDSFFQKYRSDSVFQVNHIKFPLKCFYIDETEDTTINFTEKKDWSFDDFQNNTQSQYDQYEFVKNAISSNVVSYEMKGIDNGISVSYKFKLENQKWILIEIEDASF